MVGGERGEKDIFYINNFVLVLVQIGMEDGVEAVLQSVCSNGGILFRSSVLEGRLGGNNMLLEYFFFFLFLF